MKLLKLLSVCSIAVLISSCNKDFPDYPVKVVRIVIAQDNGTQASLACDLVNAQDIVYKCRLKPDGHADWQSIQEVNGWICMSPENKQQLEKAYLDGKDKYKLCKK